MNPIQDSFSFLVTTVFQLYMLLVLLRFLFQLCRVNFRNPMVGPIVKLTQPPLSWLRRFIPGLFGIDLSALVLFILLALLKLFLLSVIGPGSFSIAGGVIWAIAKLLDTTIWLFIVAIFMQAIMSWFMPQPGHPMITLLGDLTRPILQPIRQFLPSMGGIDFSPIVAFLVLNFLQKLLVSPLYYSAQQLM